MNRASMSKQITETPMKSCGSKKGYMMGGKVKAGYKNGGKVAGYKNGGKVAGYKKGGKVKACKMC
jgi:hypothetical protein